jgi:phage repressor protein C with HTH and peptisase S24 domain
MAKPPKPHYALTHEQIWAALDRLAARAGTSPSGLARRAGLDPTTFNRSKRTTSEGRARWPSTESVAKAIAAAGQSIDAFVLMIGDGSRPTQSAPLLTLARACDDGHFDDQGFPSGKGWDEVALPTCDGDQVFALEISGDALAPAYRDGDVVLASPATPIRRGDRVVVKTVEGEMLVCELKRRTAKTLELRTLTPSRDDRAMAAASVAWIARIVWARQ